MAACQEIPMNALRLVCAALAGLLAVAACTTSGDMAPSSSSSGTSTRGAQGMGSGYTRGGGGGGGGY
ncbi:hypothetical protein MAFF301560_07840 [Ralstonia solanacearum]|nr:hypothetical protein RSOE_21615 [Ralstonia solanacearum OE1-1]BCM01397.1 hypothetical protein MAFF301560_07840 [Ralstonia solanacearum]BEU47852.1 hypothetical protein MAFF211519_31770 [Ralstonia pseudosolanacearum]